MAQLIITGEMTDIKRIAGMFGNAFKTQKTTFQIIETVETPTPAQLPTPQPEGDVELQGTTDLKKKKPKPMTCKAFDCNKALLISDFSNLS